MEIMKEDKKEIIYRSKLPEITISDHIPLHEYCFERISDHFSRPCLISDADGRSFTYADVQITARRVAAGLSSQLGVRKGDVVMLCLLNCVEFVFSFLGATMLGAVTTTVNPLRSNSEIEKQAAAAGTRVIVTSTAFLEKVIGYGAETGAAIIVVDEPVAEGCLSFRDLLAATDEGAVPPDVGIEPDDLVAIPYSSGTTGVPKGVLRTHKSMITSVAQQVDGENPHMHLTSEDVVLCLPPLYHLYSLIAVLMCSLRVGASLVIMQNFNVNTMMELIQKYKVTVAIVIPPIALSLCKSPDIDNYDLTSIRKLVCGAAPMGKSLEDALKAKLVNAVLGQSYGMSEAALMSLSLGFAKVPMEDKAGACGSVVRNAEMKIVDTLTGVSLPCNQPGEICIRGSQIMKGYLNNSEATARTIDKEGWLHTGDVGYVDEDQNVFIVDRLVEMIMCKGSHVAPAELEDLLIDHPCISDAAVVGKKDEAEGEVPVAFIVKYNESQITEDDIKQYISQKVEEHKMIKRVFFVDSIPKNPSGKILRRELRARLEMN